MKNYVNAGANLTVIAAAAVAGGAGVLTGAIFGIAQGDAAIGEEVVVVRSGVFDLPKLEAQAWTAGAKVYWDSGNGWCTTVASGNTLIGAAAVAAANPSTVGRVLLDGAVR
jgi:predicted RecA/RadA family phage recombinase